MSDVIFGFIRRCTVHPPATGCECALDDCVPELVATDVPTATFEETDQP